MSSSRGRKNKGSLLLPIALTATAAVASLALYFWLGEDSSHDHVHVREDPRRSRRPRRLSHDRITEVSEPESAVEGGPRLSAHKRNVAIVVTSGPEDRPSSLLNHLPTPLNITIANIFVLVYAPRLSAHPLSGLGGEESTVIRQARQLFPNDYPAEFVMPFTESDSIMPLLKQLGPQTVYIEAGLVDKESNMVSALLNGHWVGGIAIARGPGEEILEEGKWGKKLRVIDVGDVGDDWMAYMTD